MTAAAAQRLDSTVLLARYRAVRAFSEQLCQPLAVEDYGLQSMPDASPAKWHLAHTSWFFETFLLEAYQSGYRAFDPAFRALFNSYYESVGPQHPRPERGMLSRPTVAEVYAYRRAVDAGLEELLAVEPLAGAIAARIELGLAHEQQHQELLLTDLQHALSKNPLAPVYLPLPPAAAPAAPARAAVEPSRYVSYPGGIVLVGADGAGFAFDNEHPRHRVLCEPFALATRLVTNAEFIEFIRQDGYARPELWLSDGWAFCRSEGLRAPLYWEECDGGYERFSLHGRVRVEPHDPVCHVSFYEADAFARWAGARLPTEFEWEIACREQAVTGHFVEDGRLLPRETGSVFGSTWVWTASPYLAYPGFAPAAGALGEYNGKFMCNQIVLRGGSCFSARDHLRLSYRNFFPPSARWQLSGIRLAR